MENLSSIRLGKHLRPLKSGLVMGIINATPDSFYAGSRVLNQKELVHRISDMVEHGADILDVGAVSSRPGAELITASEEWDRLHPVLKTLNQSFPELAVSVDTFRSEIARRAVLDFGVKMVNDISAGRFDPDMARTIGQLQVPIVLMHMQGEPGTMQNDPKYNDVTLEVITFFGQRIAEFKQYGVHDILLDPGFGFGKTQTHNFKLLRDLEMIKSLGFPIVVGLSRKSMIYKTLGCEAENALNGTTVLNTFARSMGADILRVHDVKPAVECLHLLNLLASVEKTNFPNN